MAKAKERSELEFLRSQNKSLKSEVRNLKKQVSRYEKRAHQFEDALNDDDIEQVIETVWPTNACPKCQAKLILTDIGVRKIIKCSSCDYRKVEK